MTTYDLGLTRRTLQHVRVSDRSALLRALQDLGAGADDTDLGALVRHALHRPPPDLTGLVDRTLAGCLSGWAAYFGADYTAAAHDFGAAWMEGGGHGQGPWSSWAALGLCKVSSDLGHWARARDWGLVCLSLARRENDFERMCEASGSLGEVFLRAGHPKLAYELISLDAGMLPPGSGHRDRLNNYLAVCLGRLGQFALAESTLWHSYFAAHEHDPVSASYSRSSLYVLSALSQSRPLFDRLQALAPPDPAKGAPMANAFVECIRASWSKPDSREDGDTTPAMTHLEAASKLFAARHPVESWWVEQLKDHLSGQPIHHRRQQERLEKLRARPAPAPAPRLDHVLDSRYASVALTDEPGFAQLDSDVSASPWHSLRMFFI